MRRAANQNTNDCRGQSYLDSKRPSPTEAYVYRPSNYNLSPRCLWSRGGIEQQSTGIRNRLAATHMDLRPHPYRMRSQVHGLSHGLKSVHRTLLTPVRALVPPFRFHRLYQKRTATAVLSFLVEPRGIEPLSEGNLDGLSPGAVCYLHSLCPTGTNTLTASVAS